MRATNKEFLDKFDNGWKQIKIADLLEFFAFYFDNFTLWTWLLEKFFMYPSQICYACYYWPVLRQLR